MIIHVRISQFNYCVCVKVDGKNKQQPQQSGNNRRRVEADTVGDERIDPY